MAAADDILALDAVGLAARLKARELSPVEVAEAYLDRIAATEKRLCAYVTVTAELARESARRAEREIAAGGWRGTFHGVPVALKDLCCTAGILTTSASRVLADYVPDRDATVWARLAAQGAVLLGKLNMHEFACGGTAKTAWGTTLNPYDPERLPGGSSSGSAAAIVARSAAATIGSDTGGSIRIPAAFCGCVGLKQTYSRVSRYGVLPLSDSLDHVGPITRSVRDAAAMLAVIAGHDPDDPTSSREPVPDYSAALGHDLKGVRVGVIRELNQGVTAEVAQSFQAAMCTLEGLGAAVDEVSIPSIDEAGAAAMNIMYAEALEYHERWFVARAQDYGRGVRRMLEAATALPAATYVRAARARARIIADALSAMEGRDVLATPACAMAPMTIAEARTSRIGLAQLIRHTAPFNVTGQPALAIPTGVSQGGAPLAMQIVGRPFDEAAVIRVGDAYERARGPLPPPKFA
ncbi:MAG TPA: amidase [Candidatus Binataceae bacterium]|jgi:aspartyl-tRNA(Asn)/glutamyl-tRNA(Gln) amidotransferase subunit A|nr:amidase [Candidatus Binataceae bacterium]